MANEVCAALHNLLEERGRGMPEDLVADEVEQIPAGSMPSGHQQLQCQQRARYAGRVGC